MNKVQMIMNFPIQFGFYCMSSKWYLSVVFKDGTLCLDYKSFTYSVLDTENMKGNEVSSFSFHLEVTGIIDVILSMIEIISYDRFIV